jgi:polyphosphate kinase
MQNRFFNRDKSWLAFNERVLLEANRENVPLMERINFLSIYSSNLDEFYRVRMPALMALNKLQDSEQTTNRELIDDLNSIIDAQQEKFGQILAHKIMPYLRKHQISFLYGRPIPSFLKRMLTDYFYNDVSSFIQVTQLKEKIKFFPRNNKLYILVTTRSDGDEEKYFIINIPSDNLSRFYTTTNRGIQYIVLLDDIVRLNLSLLLKGRKIISSYTFKITRSGELDIDDEFEGDLADKIEKHLQKRELGLATRFLYDGKMKKDALKNIKKKLDLKKTNNVQGGKYHNLKDLSSLPLRESTFFYKKWQHVNIQLSTHSIFDSIKSKSFLLHPPYHSFDPVLRFFNEASIDSNVTTIYVSIYRIAKNSRIAYALMNAARNGKKVLVFVELKARFDEENNLQWAKKMEGAGVKIMYSIPALKVHSKIALVKRINKDKKEYYGILGTGNFNENTATLYSDHFLFLSNEEILKEVETLFKFLRERRKPISNTELGFNHLFVGQFNLQQGFISLISKEIDNAKHGLPASITIKLNNLEEKNIIEKLYEASQAGVRISLVIRGICCLIPGVKGFSENITVKRIVDRYLEHGRVFIFENNGNPLIYLGSADWMNRNLHRRIEVCFPITDAEQKEEIIKIVNLQLADTAQAVHINEVGENQPVDKSIIRIQSQKEIALCLSRKNK